MSSPLMPATAAPNNPCPPIPCCPTCGGLECLCRPRWFAGQTITEDDLRSLDHYMLEKNKLHNRYLHGTGTVCGLQVLCHECAGWLKITSGYAIDPCGNDIIVCEDQYFDLCAKIQECCTKARDQYDCEPSAQPPPDCRNIERDWYITLRYRETPSRGVTALKQAPAAPCCPSCGTSSSGCGCGSPGNGRRSSRPAVSTLRAPAAQCEPTRTCEGFVVELAPAPPDARDQFAQTAFDGTLLGAITACIREIAAVLAKKPNPATNLNEVLIYKQAVWDFLHTHPLTRCELLARVTAIPVVAAPAAAAPNFGAAVSALDSALLEALHDCICPAVLPPCPSQAADPRVILACVTVKTDDQGCHIRNICHERGRRFVLTSPNVLYWTSIGALIKRLLEKACCNDPGERQLFILTGATSAKDPIETLMSSLVDGADKSSLSPIEILTKTLQATFAGLGLKST